MELCEEKRKRNIVDFSVDQVKFLNTGHKEYTQTYHVQNCSSFSQKIRVALKKDSSKVFTLLAGKEEKTLAAGLKKPVTIKFTPEEKPLTYHGGLDIFTEDKLQLTIPIIGHPPLPSLTFSPTSIEFGSQVCGYQSITRVITVTNNGKAEGVFSLSPSHLPSYISVTPLEGTVLPETTEQINVTLLCRKIDKIEDTISLQLDSNQHTIPISANIVRPQLEILDDETLSPAVTLSLGSTYYNTIKRKTIRVYNNSPASLSYVAKLCTDSLSYGKGVNMKGTLAMACTNGGLHQHDWREQCNAPPPDRIFEITPNEGTLRPYQTERIQICFIPVLYSTDKGWTHHQGVPLRRDYALFVHFMPVGLTSEGYDENIIELGLTATALPLQLSWQPKEVNFGKCREGVPNCQQLALKNESDDLPLSYKVIVPAHYKTTLNKGSIEPQSEQEMTVVFLPKQLGMLKGHVTVELIGDLSQGGQGAFGLVKIPLSGISCTANEPTTTTTGDGVLMVELDNLPTSVRPHDKRIDVRSPYTKIRRHTYTDPDYTYTDREAAEVKFHKDLYKNFLCEERRKRLMRETDKRLGQAAYMTSTDIGIEPGAGLSPPHISPPPPPPYTTPTINPLSLVEEKKNEFNKVANLIINPLNESMRSQCTSILTPKQLTAITLDPQTLPLGVVVVNKSMNKTITLTNGLDSQYAKIRLTATNSCIKFVHSSSTSPVCDWSCILPPLSYIHVMVSFCSDLLKDYHESITCTVNNHHHYHVPLTASVTEPSLTLSPSHITLRASPLSTINCTLEGCVTLNNPHHVPVNFKWDLNSHEEYIAVTHMEGVAPAHSSLMCAIYCQGDIPLYSTPFQLTLHIDDGSTQYLDCSLKYGKSECVFKETRILFNPAPQFLSINKPVHIINKGSCHSYYQVLGFHPPIDGLTVSPEKGCIPAGDCIQLTLQLCSSWEEPIFETWLKVKLHEGKTLSLRITGSIEAPKVFINLNEFHFGSVYCGVKKSLPFIIHNMGQSHTALTFDLTSYQDFSLILPNDDDPYKDPETSLTSFNVSPHVYKLIVPGATAVKCTMEFTPQDVASYDFILPILVNGEDPVPPPCSKWPPTHNESPQVTINSKLPSHKNTPKRRIIATSLVPLLYVENSTIDFHIAPKMNILSKLSEKEVILKNVSSDPLTWSLGDGSQKRLSDGTFKFVLHSKSGFFEPPSLSSKICQDEGNIGYLQPNESFMFRILFTPSHHGHFMETLPLFINGSSIPYKDIHLCGNMVSGRLSVTPPHIGIQPVPLGVTVEAHFIVTLERFFSKIDLSGVVPSSLPDGVSLCIDLSTPISTEEGSIQIQCVLTFSSSIPISITDCITFTENNTNIMKLVPFSVTSDNSLLSTFEFLSENLNSVNIETSNTSQVPVLCLLSNDGVHGSVSSSTLSSASSTQKAALFASATSSALEYGSLFLQQCKLALCRYIALFGWSEGVRHIIEPCSLMECVGVQGSIDIKKRYSKASSSSRGPLLDLLRHLCGRFPPGIPFNPPPCNTRIERVNRHYKELSIILAFLRTQGALLWLIVPEVLMDWKDFCYWKDTNDKQPHTLLACSTREDFEESSEKAWAHLLGQIIKVLVLPKLLSTEIKEERKEEISNVYSSNEIVLLNWLNYHFEREGKKLFGNALVSRTIQTFDVDLMDCTVLASVLTAYVPSLFSTYFSGMYPEPITPEQVTHNSLLLVDAIQSIGINYDIQAGDFSAPNPIMLILFCSHLFHILPHYIPSSSITLHGSLHSNIIKEIIVENSSNKSLLYKDIILGEDSNSFTIQKKDYITVPPKTSISVPVIFNAKSLKGSEATLILVPKGGGGRQGYPLSFHLIGQATIVHPKNTLVHEVPLYEVTNISVPVHCTTLKEATEYYVELVEGEKLLEKRQIKPKTNKQAKGIKYSSSECSVLLSTNLKNKTLDSIKLFHTSQSIISLSPSQHSTVINVQYIPLKNEPRQCSVILHNKQHGDIVYLISTTVSLPNPSLILPPFELPSTIFDKDTLYITATEGDTIKENINISCDNYAFEKAVYSLAEWDIPEDERRKLHLTGSMSYASLSSAIKALSLDNSLKTYWDHLPEGSDDITFKVSCPDTEYIKLPSTISLSPFDKTKSSTIPIEFNCEKEGHYTCHVILSSPHDVRVYCVEVMVIVKYEEPVIEFKTPAFQRLLQRIPLTNLTTADWPLKATITGQRFSGPSSLIVDSSSTGYYPLCFEPRREETIKCQLLLVNTNDQTEHSFQLIGIGERPLAQDNINIHTKAKERTSLILHVPNTSDRTTVYKVETDIEFITGPPLLTVAGNDVADYPIMIDPLVRGHYTGAIVFIVESRSGRVKIPSGSTVSPEHLWYQFDVIVDPAQPIDTYQLTAPTFSDNTLEIKLYNPILEPVTLQVTIEGSYLSGPSEIALAAESEGVYPLTYSPQRIGKEKGGVLFLGLPDGEVSVEIELESGNPRPVEISPPKCELGKSAYTTLPLNNPLDQEVTLTYHQTDGIFVAIGLENGTLVLPPQSSSDVTIMFKPTHLGQDHATILTFTSNEFGCQEFVMRGEGLPPSLLPQTIISSVMYQNTIAILSFTNPLSIKANFTITMSNQSDQFCLFLKQTRNISLKSGVSLDIPVMYTPESIEQCHSHISISTNDSSAPLSWVYPLLGQPEVILAPSKVPLLVTRAKERVEERLVVVLYDDGRPITPLIISDKTNERLQGESEAHDEEENKYSYRLVLTDENSSNSDLFHVSTGLRFVKEIAVTNNKIELIFDVVFLPPKPFSCKAELQIQPGSYALWRYPVTFTATEPVPDDVITLQALHLTGEVKKSFRLTSRIEQPLPFKAYFTLVTPELSMVPTEGILPPVNQKGLLFTITYKPRSFSKDCCGKMVVETPVTYWMYEVKGEPVAYSKPPGVTAKVDHHSPIVPQPSTKNFIRRNIQQLHVV